MIIIFFQKEALKGIEIIHKTLILYKCNLYYRIKSQFSSRDYKFTYANLRENYLMIFYLNLR